jgi:chromosome segregation ATPase
MSEDMQLQLDGIKTELSGVQRRLGAVESRLDGVETRLGGVETRLDGVETRLDGVEKTVHNIAVTVSRHEGYFFEIKEQLKKLDALERIERTMDALAGELKSSRAERALSDKSYRDQQATLSDHEVRIHRLERNSKPS